MSYSQETVEQAVKEKKVLGLPCGCRITFRGTLENPIADHEPCPFHGGPVNMDRDTPEQERLKAFLADVAGKIERGEL